MEDIKMRTLIYNVTTPNTLSREGYVVAVSTARYGYWCKHTNTGIIQLAHLGVGDMFFDEGNSRIVKICRNGIRVSKTGRVLRYEIDVEDWVKPTTTWEEVMKVAEGAGKRCLKLQEQLTNKKTFFAL